MKASELRIGNLIFDSECDPHIFKVEEIKKHIGFENWIFYRNGSIKAKEVEGITLTEEWILKFGFEKQENNWKRLCICNDWTYLYWERLAGVELSVDKHSVMLSHIKYVHQLQNLFFALTNQELTIKEATK